MVRSFAVLFCLSAFAALAAEPQCKSDVECPGREVCAEGRCVVPGQYSGPSGPTAPGRPRDAPVTGSAPRVASLFGLFADFYPSSSRKVPGSSTGQMALLVGGRAGVGVLVPRWIIALALVETGYAAAGRGPGNGDDGFMLGFGAEVVFARWEQAQPFVRFTYDLKLITLTQDSSGTLADSAWAFAFGARLVKFLDLHLLVGSDYAGGFSPGIGVGFFAANQ